MKQKSQDEALVPLCGKSNNNSHSANECINRRRKSCHYTTSQTRKVLWISTSFSNCAIHLFSLTLPYCVISTHLCVSSCVTSSENGANGAVVIIGLGFPCQCVCLFCALLRWFLLCDISDIQGNKREDYIHCLVWQDPFHHPPSGYIISNCIMICSSITITT